MTANDNILCALVRAGLGTGKEEDRALFTAHSIAAEWHSVFKAAARQGVLAIAYDGLRKIIDAGMLPAENRPDSGLNIRWAYNVQTIEETYARQKMALARMTRFFAASDIPVLLLKGYGLSICYPHPEHRPCGDIDIWLFGKQQQADDLLRSKGVKVDVDKHHHTIFYVNGVMVENHFDFINVYAHLSNRQIEQELKRLAQTQPSERTDVEGAEVRLPSPDFTALFMLKHSAGHFASEDIGLRHLADWAMYVKRYGDRIDWQWLEDLARKKNMHLFLHCLNALAVDIIGIDGGCIPSFGRNAELEERILTEILHPAFSEKKPAKNAVRIIWFKCRRWWANRWKHRIVYPENALVTFVVQVYCHLLKPKGITH